MGSAASVGAMGLTALSNVMTGQGTKAADNAQAGELDERAQLAQVAATETNANLTEKLNQSIGNLAALRAAAGDSPTSPTDVAVRSQTEAYANQNRVIQVGNILSQSEADTASANYLRQAGSFALNTSYLKAAGGILSGLASMSRPGGTDTDATADATMLGALY